MRDYKILSLIFFFSCSVAFSQSLDSLCIENGTEFYNCEDRWVVHCSASDGKPKEFGYIFIHPENGFSFSPHGELTGSGDSNYIISDSSSATMANCALLTADDPGRYAPLPDSICSQLHLPPSPPWLADTRVDLSQAGALNKWGQHYKEAAALEEAIYYFSRALDLEPDSMDFRIDLAEALNAARLYDRTVEILQPAILDTTHFPLLKELSFAYISQGKFDRAEKLYDKAFKLQGHYEEKTEMAINMAYGYYLHNDRENFKKWAHNVKVMTGPRSKYFTLMERLEKELGSQ